MKRKQEEMIGAYNAKLKELEDAGVNVKMEKLMEIKKMASPFSGTFFNQLSFISLANTSKFFYNTIW